LCGISSSSRAAATACGLALWGRTANASDLPRFDDQSAIDLVRRTVRRGLAPQIVTEVAAVLRRLRESGLSIVLVEQNIKLALEIADEVWS
jgi:hypothetical protein